MSYLWATVSSNTFSRKHLAIVLFTLAYIPLTRAHQVLPLFSIAHYTSSSHFIFYIARAVNFLIITGIAWHFSNTPFQKSFRNVIITIWIGYAISEAYLALPLFKDYWFGTGYLLGIFVAPALILLLSKFSTLLKPKYKPGAIKYSRAQKMIDELTSNELKKISLEAQALHTLPELITDTEDFDLLRSEILSHTHKMSALLNKVELQITMFNLKNLQK